MDSNTSSNKLETKKKELIKEYENAPGSRKVEIIREITNINWDLYTLRLSTNKNS